MSQLFCDLGFIKLYLVLDKPSMKKIFLSPFYFSSYYCSKASIGPSHKPFVVWITLASRGGVQEKKHMIIYSQHFYNIYTINSNYKLLLVLVLLLNYIPNSIKCYRDSIFQSHIIITIFSATIMEIYHTIHIIVWLSSRGHTKKRKGNDSYPYGFLVTVGKRM